MPAPATASTTAPATAPTLPFPARRLLAASAWLTTPLLPGDYLSLVNPLWSTRELRGRVEGVRPETADAATLVVRPGWGWTGHRAGQYVGVGVEIDGVRHWRSYSLTSSAARRDRFEITVKAIPNGRVSQHLVHGTRPGGVLHLRPAQGDFVLPTPVPPRLLFVTAGSGLTPVMGMLRSLAAGDDMPDVVLVHSAPTPAETIFDAELRDLSARFPALRLHQRHTRTDGRFCPRCARTGIGGLDHRLHVERFRPPVRAAASGTPGGSSRVRFAKTGREVDAGEDTALLTVGEDAGVVMPSGCRMGICFGCVAPLRYGQVRDLRTGRVHGDEGDLVQTCVSAAAGPIELDL